MKYLISVLAAVFSLAGCASAPMSPTDPAGALTQYQWHLSQAHDKDGQHINALFARPDKPLELSFQNGQVHVGNACNLLNGQVAIHDGKIETTQIVSTMMACANPAVTGLDKAISSRLKQSDTFRINTNVTPPTLTLTTPDGDILIFTGEPRSH